MTYKHFESKKELLEEAITAPVHDLLEVRIEVVRCCRRTQAAWPSASPRAFSLAALLQMFVKSVGALGAILFGDQDHARPFYIEHLRPLIDALIDITSDDMNSHPGAH